MSLTATAQPTQNQNRVWEFQFDGIEKITPTKGPLGDDQIEIMLSGADKVDALVMMCQFTESNPNPKYCRFGFGSKEVNHLTLWGPDVDHATLLDTLQSAIKPNKDAKAFQFSLIQ